MASKNTSTPTTFNDPRLVAIDKMLASMGLPTYKDAVCAACDLADGNGAHDMVDNGLSQSSADTAVAVFAGAMSLWLTV